MKALVYNAPLDVSVIELPDARIEEQTEILVRITTTNICGSDLHMYDGRTDVEKRQVLGHENMGEVIEVGSAVDRIKVGDVVCPPSSSPADFATMNNLVKAVKATANIGVAGVFVAKDPKSSDELAKKGQIAFDFGEVFTKGQRIGTVQANVKATTAASVT